VPRRVAIATEGVSSEEVLDRLCRRLGVVPVVKSTEGKPRLFQDFDKILRFYRDQADIFLVVPDLHPDLDCVSEADRWRAAIAQRFPRARLCLAIWETESWFMADPSALRQVLGIELQTGSPESTHHDPPSTVLERECKRVHGYRNGSAFHKRVDGARLADVIDLHRVRGSCPSFARFAALVGSTE
jgi:Domain of unknown function (DUF4276)